MSGMDASVNEKGKESFRLFWELSLGPHYYFVFCVRQNDNQSRCAYDCAL